MSHPRTRPGGGVLFREGEKARADDQVDVGSMMWQTLTALLARLVENDNDGDPFEGFFGDDCLVTVSSGLTLSIAAGLGYYYDTSASDEFGPIYKPIAVSAAFTATLDAHNPSNPRYDVLSLAPATDDDQAATRYVMDGSGVVSSQAVDKRRRFAYSLTVTKGTAGASPVVPATPSGHIKIAEVYVPASSGAVTIYDTRPILRLGHDLVDHAADALGDHVVGSSTELQVSASSPASMVVSVARGDAVIDGYRYSYPRTLLTIAAAHATLDRVDVVVADVDGTVQVVAGTAGGAPGAAGAGQVLLATIAVDATVTTITGGDITDGRVRESLDGGQIQDDTVTCRAMAGRNKAAQIHPPSGVGTEGAVVANGFDFDIQLYDGDNNEIADNAQVLIEVFTPTMQPAGSAVMTITDQGAGSMVSTTGQDKVIFQLDSTGLGHIRIYDASGAATGAYRVRFTVLEDYVPIITHATCTFA